MEYKKSNENKSKLIDIHFNRSKLDNNDLHPIQNTISIDKFYMIHMSPIIANCIMNNINIEENIELLSRFTQQKSFGLNDCFINIAFLNRLAEIIDIKYDDTTILIHLIIILHNFWYHADANMELLYNERLMNSFVRLLDHENDIVTSYVIDASHLLMGKNIKFVDFLIKNRLLDAIYRIMMHSKDNINNCAKPIAILYYLYQYLGENNQILDIFVPIYIKFICSKYTELRKISTNCLLCAMKTENGFQNVIKIPDALTILKNAQYLELIGQVNSLYECYCILFSHNIYDIIDNDFFVEIQKTMKKYGDINDKKSLFITIKLLMPNYWMIINQTDIIKKLLKLTKKGSMTEKVFSLNCLIEYALYANINELIDFGINLDGFKEFVYFLDADIPSMIKQLLISINNFMKISPKFVEIGNELNIIEYLNNIENDDKEIYDLVQSILQFYK